MPGGFFLEQRGEIQLNEFALFSLEILSYEPSLKIFTALVYSSISGTPIPYYWDVQGDIVTHWTKSAKYTGEFSEDNTVLSGGWRPEKGEKETPGNTYDAVMTRILE